MLFLSDIQSVNSLTGQIDDKIILVGDVVCPTQYIHHVDKKLEHTKITEAIEQIPIYPNTMSLSFNERIVISIPTTITETLNTYKKNVYLGVDLLLRWSKKTKAYKNFFVVGMYQNQYGKIYTQQLEFKKGKSGLKLFKYEERETHEAQINQYLAWTVDKAIDAKVEHIFFAGNVNKSNFVSSNQPGFTSFVGTEPFEKTVRIPLRLSNTKSKGPIVSFATAILFSATLFAGTNYYIETKFNAAKAEHERNIKGIEEIYSSNTASSSITLIQQRQYFLESLAKSEKPSKNIKSLIKAIGSVKKRSPYQDTQLLELVFSDKDADLQRSFSLKLSLPKSDIDIKSNNEIFHSLIDILGAELNVELYSLSRPQEIVLNEKKVIILHIGGKFVPKFEGEV